MFFTGRSLFTTRMFGVVMIVATVARSLLTLHGMFLIRCGATASIGGLVRRIVEPSGADCAATLAPSVPPAPPRFSAYTVWLGVLVNPAATTRPTESDTPPGP